jgi:hypothetical protein
MLKVPCRCTRCAPTSTTARRSQDHDGIIGIKVWVYKGEIMEHDPMAQDKRLESSGQSRARAANQRGPATGASRPPEHRDASTEANQIPQGLQRPIHGHSKAGFSLAFGEYRPESGRAGADHRAPDRGNPSCHYPSDETSG